MAKTECEYATINRRRDMPAAASTIGNHGLWCHDKILNKCVSANTQQLTSEERCRRLHQD
eukprot:scaffold13538_cov72-Cyclotella_meneghiniana.AAC.5